MRSFDHAQDAAQLRQEAHVEHPVGLVDDDQPDAIEFHLPTLEVIDKAPRARDYYLGSAQFVDLAVHRFTTDHDRGAKTGIACEQRELTADLSGQFPGGSKDHRVKPARAIAMQAIEQWKQKRRGLAAAGACARDQIAARECYWNCIGLDRGWLMMSAVANRAQDFR